MAFHCVFSLTAISCSFISARVCALMWVRVSKSLLNTSAICTEKCLYSYISFSRDPLSILLVSRPMVKCYAPQLCSRFYSQVESSWVVAAAAAAVAVAVAAPQLCGLPSQRQIYVRRVFRMWTQRTPPEIRSKPFAAACKLLTHLEMKVNAMIFANLQFNHCFSACAENCLVERDLIFKNILRYCQRNCI